jgi:uncharacterized protein YbcC (UPF0753/DUF2309 family)
VRPEWALAGCKAFIAAPRGRTAGQKPQGRAFLHDYDWQQDKDFGVLELIMTAPVVVASWISLQYYGSTVAPGCVRGGQQAAAQRHRRDRRGRGQWRHAARGPALAVGP